MRIHLFSSSKQMDFILYCEARPKLHEHTVTSEKSNLEFTYFQNEFLVNLHPSLVKKFKFTVDIVTEHSVCL